MTVRIVSRSEISGGLAALLESKMCLRWGRLSEEVFANPIFPKPVSAPVPVHAAHL